MSQTPLELLDAILKLSEADRIMIANRLLEDLSDSAPGLSESHPNFEDELRRRSGNWDGAASWESVRDDLRRHP